jgi:hypothetical protein
VLEEALCNWDISRKIFSGETHSSFCVLEREF